MGLKSRYEANVMKKISQRFLLQYEYAGQVLYATFADEIDKQADPNLTGTKDQKLLLEIAVRELLGSPLSAGDLNEAQKSHIRNNIPTIQRFKAEIMGSQPDVREFVVQTARMMFFLDMMATNDSAKFLNTPQGKALEKVLSEYGGEFPQVNPSMYDKICESVAKKTNTVKQYQDMLKGK